MRLIKIIASALATRCLSELNQVGLRGYAKVKPSLKTIQQSLTDNPNTSDGRIVGGVKANKSEFPWLVSIGNQYSGHMCGGTLIHEKVILTAAHCISDKYETEDLYVGYGKNDLDGVDGEEYKVSKTIKHGNYSEKGIELLDDIGIYILKEEVKGGKIVPKISDIGENYEDESFIVAGWGHTKFEGQMSNSLLKVSLKIIDTKTCKKTWSSLDERFSICAGTKEGGKDACQGDSGGPLMKSDEDGQYSIVGVVSNGIKCAEPGVPGTYAKVRSYLPWIQKAMKKENLELQLK